MANSLVEEKVVCPHCWRRFFGDQASYITQHNELYGDPILGANHHQRFSYLEIKRNRDGEPLDPKGWVMRERACPNCHLQIPRDLLERRPRFISLVGAPSSGKTYFLTALLHYLRTELAQYFNYSIEVSDYHYKNIFSDHAKGLYSAVDQDEPALLKKTEQQGDLYNTITLDGVEVVLPKPFIFSILPIDQHVHISDDQVTSVVFYDNSGESFYFRQDDDGSRRHTQHLGESDVVLFAYDLLLDPAIRQRLRSISSDPQVGKASKSASQEDILTATVQRIRRYGGLDDREEIDATLIVCVQKYDVWKPLMPCVNESDAVIRLIDHSSIEYLQQHGVGGLDVQEMNAISLLVEHLIKECSPGFVASAKRHFREVRYFPVSAFVLVQREMEYRA